MTFNDVVKEITKIVKGMEIVQVRNWIDVDLDVRVFEKKHDWVRIIKGGQTLTLTIGTVQYDGYTYEDGEYNVYCNVDGFISPMKYLSPSIQKYIEDIDKDLLLNEIKKHKLKDYECFWVSNKGDLYAGNRKIKPGKILKALGADDAELQKFIEDIEVKKINFHKQTRVASVQEVYTSKKLKVISCMTGSDMRIYDKIDAESIYLVDANENILARTILWENKFHDKVYATSETLRSKFQNHLEQLGYSRVTEYTTNIIPGRIDDYFIPYMDTVSSVNVIHWDGGGVSFQFTTDKSDIQAKRDDGRVNIEYRDGTFGIWGGIFESKGDNDAIAI